MYKRRTSQNIYLLTEIYILFNRKQRTVLFQHQHNSIFYNFAVTFYIVVVILIVKYTEKPTDLQPVIDYS
jgi:hypothetical protein